MSYNNAIPQPTDLISNSQAQILGNFAAIDSGTTGTGAGFSRNHITMTDGTNGGLHYRVDYYQATSDPVISGFIASLYPKTVTNAELFYANASTISQLTGLTLVTTNPSPNAYGYGITTPWGVTLNWGNIPNVGSGGSTSAKAVVFQIPFTTSVDSIVVTGRNGNGSQGNATTSNETITGFNVYSSNNNAVYFFAIGH